MAVSRRTKLTTARAAAQLRQSTRRLRQRSELDRTLPERRASLAQPVPVPITLRTPARPAQPLEPILFPKLRIQFADFPYLHCSIGQRLCTLETCCGCGYGPARNSLCLPRIFTGRRRRTGHRQSCGALRRQRPYLGTSPFQGVCQVLTKKRELFPGPTPPSPSSLASPRPTGANESRRPISASGFGNVNPIPFRRCRARAFTKARPLNGVGQSLRTD